MQSEKAVFPRWVLVDEQPRNVSEFAHLPPDLRPKAYCPVCKRLAIFKLGNVRVHHYAHHPGQECPATRSETALHLNVKLHIAQQLELHRPLFIEQLCEGAYGCSQTRLLTWVAGWDEVQVEYAIDSYRPDIALLQAGRILGAIEVLVTHTVSPQKGAYFAEEGISWLEVRADETLYEGDGRWLAEQPLPYDKLFPKQPNWVCESCRESKLQAEVQQKELERRRLHDKRNRTYTHAAKMVDFYYPSGEKYREVFYVKIQLRNGKRTKAWVEKEGYKPLGLAVTAAQLTKDDMRQLSERVRQYIDSHSRTQGTIVDTPVKWRRWVEGQKFHPLDFDRHPLAYEWDTEARKWRKAKPNRIISDVYGFQMKDKSDFEAQRSKPKSLLGQHDMGSLRPSLKGHRVAVCRRCGQVVAFDSTGKLIKTVDEVCPGERLR